VQESLAEISHRAQESFAGIRVVKGYGLESHAMARFAEVSGRNRDHQNLLGSARGLNNSLVYLARDLAFLPVLLVGGLLMVDRGLEVGDLFKFIDLGMKVFWPVIALGWIAGLLPRALVSAERIDEMLGQETRIAEPPSPRASDPERRVRGGLSLRNVSFRYADSPRLALADVSLEVPAGTALGVVGPTGSGKSTLLLALGRLHDVEGTIALDGVPIREIPLDVLRGALGYVPQDSFLFSAPYRENVEFGADEPLSQVVLERVTELAGMGAEVASLPGGYDQLIGERGVTLSGGQRQRICIARALAKDPEILVLDDAMSAVDTDTEARLLASLRGERRGRTLVVAAHRLASVRHAERIAVLREGHLDALGTHAELLRANRWYRETWNRQRTKDELERL
jgi:ATP-binding cassette subfamily B protein